MGAFTEGSLRALVRSSGQLDSFSDPVLFCEEKTWYLMIGPTKTYIVSVNFFIAKAWLSLDPSWWGTLAAERIIYRGQLQLSVRPPIKQATKTSSRAQQKLRSSEAEMSGCHQLVSCCRIRSLYWGWCSLCWLPVNYGVELQRIQSDYKRFSSASL